MDFLYAKHLIDKPRKFETTHKHSMRVHTKHNNKLGLMLGIVVDSQCQLWSWRRQYMLSQRQQRLISSWDTFRQIAD